MNFFDTLREMLVILFAMAMGFLAHRLGYFNAETDQRLSKVILNLTMPAMIVAAVITGDTLPELREVLAVLEVAAVFYLLEMVFALIAPAFWGAHRDRGASGGSAWSSATSPSSAIRWPRPCSAPGLSSTP